MKISINQAAKELLNSHLEKLEEHLSADVLSYYGPIMSGVESIFLRAVEGLTVGKDEQCERVLYIILTTLGGSAEAVERCVNIVRHHYDEVNFIVPNYAYSAGTIFCMSGDRIFMDYYSVLGPIDPQVESKGETMVPALGYLDKINELLEKSRAGILTDAEFLILKDFDLAELRSYEQAKELTIDQLKKWLVKYKFKKWDKHKNGKTVTQREKVKTAEKIAKILSDTKIWKTHGRPIDIVSLEKDVGLEIDDFGKKKDLRDAIRIYDTFAVDFITQNKYRWLIHTRKDLL